VADGGGVDVPQALSVAPAARKLRADLIEGVERRLCFRFHVWPRQFTAKPDEKAICKSLETGKRYRFLAKKEIGATQLHISDVYNTHCCMEIWLVR
jgi:hypothetical protein